MLRTQPQKIIKDIFKKQKAEKSSKATLFLARRMAFDVLENIATTNLEFLFRSYAEVVVSKIFGRAKQRFGDLKYIIYRFRNLCNDILLHRYIKGSV